MYRYLIIIFILITISCSPEKSSETAVDEPLFTSPIGIQAYSFRNQFPDDLIGTLDKIQEMGITEIEGVPSNVPPQEFKKLCNERGINIPATGLGFDLLRDDPDSVVAIAKALGARYVMCAWIPHPERGRFTRNDADNAIEVFEKVGKVLKNDDITFCYHVHGYEFQPYEEGTLMDYMIQNSDPELVSYEMDVFWVQFGGGDPVDLLKKYGDRWKLLHLKDMQKGIAKDLTGGTSEEYNVPLGEGQIDMEGIIREAQKIGIAHYFIEDESSAVMEQVPKSISYLRGLTK